MSKKILIVANDAGAARIIYYYLIKNVGLGDFYLYLNGPAKDIFLNFPLKSEFLDEYSYLKFDKVITGTSLESDLEREAIIWSKKNGIESQSFIDHWDLYLERFLYKGDYVYPDSIIVGDDYALEVAKKCGLPISIVKKINNAYFEHIANKANNLQINDGYSILYCFDGVSRTLKARFGDNAHLYDDEIDILSNFVNEVSKSKNINNIIFRLHPADDKHKYDAALNLIPNHIKYEISTISDLTEDINRCNMVVGAETMAMVIALYMQKKVFSYISGKSYDISLPHLEIGNKESFINMLKGVK